MVGLGTRVAVRMDEAIEEACENVAAIRPGPLDTMLTQMKGRRPAVLAMETRIERVKDVIVSSGHPGRHATRATTRVCKTPKQGSDSHGARPAS